MRKGSFQVWLKAVDGSTLGSSMDVDLSPKIKKKVYGGDGGTYYAWCLDDLPMLRKGNIGAAKLAIEKNAFALPRYSNSAKVAYVLQGTYLSRFSVYFAQPFVGFSI